MNEPKASSPGVALVGREQEVAALQTIADEVRTRAEARVMTLVGPNGVGKSRLLDEITGSLAKEDSVFRVFRGGAKNGPLGQGSLASLLRARFGLEDATDVRTSVERVRRQVSEVLDDRKVGDVCFFLGQLLELPFPDSPLTKAMTDDPKQGELLRRAVIKNFFESDAFRGPLCLVFDDLDTEGEDTVALVAYLVEHLSGPVLLLCSTRPEMLARNPRWFDLGDGRHRRLDVGPVPEPVAAQIMLDLLAPCDGGPPAQLVDAGVKLAGGNAGLLQAIVQIFLDSGVLEPLSQRGEGREWRVNLDRLSDVQLPSNVEDTVAMRVASLSSEERMLLEHAAAMGSVFWLGGLLALHRLGRRPPKLWEDTSARDLGDIERTLDSLQDRDYVLKMPSSSLQGETEYVFKHSLEREKLGALTSEEAKRRYHQTIADWLRKQETATSVREHTALLAHHLDSAGSKVAAGLLYLSAGDSARASYAAKDACEYYSRGLGLLGDVDAHRRIDALHNYGDVLLLLGRTDEALEAFREMLSLAYRLDMRAKGGAAHNRIGRLYRAMGLLSEAMRHLETALRLFESVDDARGVASCHDDAGKLLWTKGEYEPALERLKQALEMRKKIGDRRSIALSLHNIGIVWRDHARPNRAQEALEASLTLRKEIGDLLGVSQTLNSMGKLAQDQRQLDRARDLFRQAYEVAKEVGERNHIAVVLTDLGEVHYRLGQAEEAIRILKQAEELCDELGDRLHLAEAKRGLAKAYLMQSELKKARASIKHAVDLFGQVRSKSHLATALRTLGEITAAGAWGAAHEGKAVDYFMRSIALCKEIGNEIEIAKSYRSFAEYVSRSDHYKKNEEIQREATKLRAMAEEIFERLRIPPERAQA